VGGYVSMLGEIKEQNKWKIVDRFIQRNQAQCALHVESRSLNVYVKRKRLKNDLHRIQMTALSGLDGKSGDEKERRLP
jgi:hypothetical protein